MLDGHTWFVVGAAVIAVLGFSLASGLTLILRASAGGRRGGVPAPLPAAPPLAVPPLPVPPLPVPPGQR